MFKSNSAQIIVFSAQPTVNEPKRCLTYYMSQIKLKKKKFQMFETYSLDWIR